MAGVERGQADHHLKGQFQQVARNLPEPLDRGRKFPVPSNPDGRFFRQTGWVRDLVLDIDIATIRGLQTCRPLDLQECLPFLNH